eukprot:10937516-Alexandrium_andersonii.AAC.1
MVPHQRTKAEESTQEKPEDLEQKSRSPRGSAAQAAQEAAAHVAAYGEEQDDPNAPDQGDGDLEVEQQGAAEWI